MSVATASGLQTAGAASLAPFCRRVMTGRMEASISVLDVIKVDDISGAWDWAGPVTVNSSMMSSQELYPPNVRYS